MITEKKDYIDECIQFAKRQASKQQKYSKNKQKRGNIQFLMPKAYKKTSQKK